MGLPGNSTLIQETASEISVYQFWYNIVTEIVQRYIGNFVYLSLTTCLFSSLFIVA